MLLGDEGLSDNYQYAIKLESTITFELDNSFNFAGSDNFKLFINDKSIAFSKIYRYEKSINKYRLVNIYKGNNRNKPILKTKSFFSISIDCYTNQLDSKCVIAIQ
jgi:hypothetical protein